MFLFLFYSLVYLHACGWMRIIHNIIRQCDVENVWSWVVLDCGQHNSRLHILYGTIYTFIQHTDISQHHKIDSDNITTTAKKEITQPYCIDQIATTAHFKRTNRISMHLFLIMGPRVMITIISIQIWYSVHFSWNSYSLQKCIYEWEIIQTKQRQERNKKHRRIISNGISFLKFNRWK